MINFETQSQFWKTYSIWRQIVEIKKAKHSIIITRDNFEKKKLSIFYIES